jgi:hypothetical protein
MAARSEAADATGHGAHATHHTTEASKQHAETHGKK